MKTVLVPLSGDAQRVDVIPDGNFFQTITVFGLSGFRNAVPQINTGSIYVGFSQTQLPWTVTTGANLTLNLVDKIKNNLTNVWIKGGSTDGAYVICH